MRGRSHHLSSAGLVLGILSLLWLVVRSGRRPGRLLYPCQRAALANASLLLVIPLVHVLRREMGRRGRSAFAVTLLSLASIGAVGLSGLTDIAPVLSASRVSAPAPPPHADYRASLWYVDGAGGPSGTHHLGVDELLSCMAAGGLPFYRSDVIGPESGPGGVVGAADVVLVKINSQWNQRGGTNTDVLEGIVARVLEHPDGFAGEVVVIENTQQVGNLDWPQANAENTSQSALDVVNAFAALDMPVSAYALDGIRQTQVQEYSAADLRDGYVVGPYQDDVHMSVSYPKFRTARGKYVSLKHGLWNPLTSAYDESQLTFLNVPVLKCHGAVYGVTATVKNHVGTMTTSLATYTHSAVRYGGLGKFLAEVRLPDLNILDCIYILARPGQGPSCTYADATRADKLVAGTDPVAIDLWATKNILVPAIVANGYTSWPMQDPDDPTSIFRIYLDAAARELVEGGKDVTNDLSRIDVWSCSALDAPEPDAAPEPVGAFPNPFTATTTIRFAAHPGAPCEVAVHDVSGRRVRTLPAAPVPAASGSVAWDGRDEAGRPVPPGTYFWRAGSASGRVTRVR